MPVATAKPAPVKRGAPVKVTRVVVTPPRHGRSALLVQVRYPIAMLGHRLSLRVFARDARGRTIRSWRLHPLASAGKPRAGEKRRRFRFVHRIGLNRQLTRRAASGLRFRVEAIGFLDANQDGKPELIAGDGEVGTLSLKAKRPRLCSSVPQRRVGRARTAVVALPACTMGRRWALIGPPAHGRALVHGGRLIYRAAKGFRGTDSVQLVGAPPRGTRFKGKRALTPVTVVFKVKPAAKAVVRAMGDSVTAGFGYYDTGKTMSLLELPECKPGSVTLVDACSSNSLNTNNYARKLRFAPDYGLSNNVSWAAQWANEYGVTNYENLAISGAEPGQWAPGGPLYPLTKQIESEDPDYILMTIGANPLLSEMLFGIDHMGCAIFADIFGDYRACIEEAFAKIGLHENLEHLFRELVEKTSATIYLMQYHLSIPSSALAYSSVQIAQMAEMMNAEIAAVAAAVNPGRLQVVTPPHFNVGVDLEPVYPSRYSCSRLGYKVDGPSVQSTLTQDELQITHPLSFCSGPVHGPPWVISGDTGIHPSATGYTQMASQVPAPR